MRYSMHTTRARVAAVVFSVGLAAAVAFGLPAVGDEGAPPPDTEPPPSRVADDGSIIPEPDPPSDPEDAVESRAELVAIEKQLDPEGSPAIFVCASEGDFKVKVIEGHEPPPDAKTNPLAGPLLEAAADPCAGYDWVVGR